MDLEVSKDDIMFQNKLLQTLIHKIAQVLGNVIKIKK